MSIPVILMTAWAKEPLAPTLCSIAMPFSTDSKFLMLWLHMHGLLSSKQTWELTNCTSKLAPCSVPLRTWLRCRRRLGWRQSKFLTDFDIFFHILLNNIQQVWSDGIEGTIRHSSLIYKTMDGPCQWSIRPGIFIIEDNRLPTPSTKY